LEHGDINKNSMKTKVIISNYDDMKNPYYAGGGAFAIHEVAKRLSTRYDLTVITASYPGARDERIDGVSYHRVGNPHMGPKIGQIFYQLSLLREVTKTDFDVWIESLTPPFSVSLLPLLSKKPLIGLVHMLAGEDMRRKYHLPFDVVEMFGLRFYRRFIVLSAQIESVIRKASPNSSIRVIPNGVTASDQVERSAHQGSTILFLGRLEIDQKGLDLLLDAFSAVRKAMRCTLVIAGKGLPSDMKRLSDMISRHPYRNDIKRIGHIVQRQKYEALGDADCVVVPSRYETFSLTALECLANGVPLVTFPISGLSWIPASARVIASSVDAPALARAIHRTLSNSSVRDSAVMEGRKFAQGFDWDKISDRYAKVIEEARL
jgi:glycosyltransferase involved in cell wall biosynthesis